MATTKTMSVKVLNVCKTTTEWAAVTTVIDKGLLCVEFTDDGKIQIKIGNGSKTFAELPYVVDGSFSISDYYTIEEADEAINSAVESAVQALGNVMHIKGVKATVEELPTEGNEIGDLWFVGTLTDGQADSYSEYVWTADSVWEFIGRANASVDLTDYAKTSYVDGLIQQVNERLDQVEEDLAALTGEDGVITDLEARVSAIEEDYIKSTDELTLECRL